MSVTAANSTAENFRKQSFGGGFVTIGVISGLRPPARTALAVGGLLGGLDNEAPSHLASDHPVSFSLDVRPARKDPWDRNAIVRRCCRA